MPWVVVLDFNQLYNADLTHPDIVDKAAFGHMEISTEPGSDLRSYGVSRTLYTALPAQVAVLRHSFSPVFFYIVIAAIDGIDTSPPALQQLSNAVGTITSALYTKERNWMMMPIVSSPTLIGSPGLREVLLPLVRSDTESQEARALDELELCGQCASDADFLEAFIAGRVNCERYVEFYAATEFYNKVGLPRIDLVPFMETMDFLSYSAERVPCYVTLEEITDLEREFGADEVAGEVRRVEFKRFLGGKEKVASWLLFSPSDHSKVVYRDVVGEIVAAVMSHNYQTIFLPYMIGTGATTIARNVLYEVRDKFVCIVLKKRLQSADAMEAAKKLFLRLGKKTGLPLLVLLDYGLNLQGLDNVRAQLIRSEVYFLCPYREATRSANQEKMADPPQKSQLTIKLSSELSAEEKRRFSALLLVDGVDHVLPDGTSLAHFLTPQGNFKPHVEGVNGWAEVCGRLVSMTNQQLVSIRLSPINIVFLRNYQRDRMQFGRSDIFETRRDCSLPPVLYGLFGFDESYANQAGAFLLEVLDELDVYELEIVQLCCFLAIFAPPVNLSHKVALFLESRRQKWVTRTVSWSDNLLALVEVLDTQPPVELALRGLQLAYKLAESPKVFGARQRWPQKVGSYVTENLFPMLSGPFGRELVVVLEPALRQAFVGFKIWHPAGSIDLDKAEKALSYSFLIRLMLFGNKGTIALAKDFMRRLVSAVDDPEKLYATHCARLLTGQGERENNFDEILEAEAILLRNNSPHLPVVCDRLGHVYKAHLRVLLHKFSTNPPSARLTLGEDEPRGQGIGFLERHSTHRDFYSSTSSKPALISFETICAIALEADKHFRMAMNLSGYAYPNPMVGATQTWDAVLEIVNCALCEGRYDLFHKYYSGRTEHATLPEVFKKLKNLSLLEYCTDCLHAARKATRYKTTGHDTQGNQDLLFASHIHVSTQEKISVLKRHIAKYFRIDKAVRSFDNFSVPTAKYLMEWAERHSELTCDKLCYCLLTFANELFPLAGVKARPSPTGAAADQRAVVSMELFFTAGCTLTSSKFSAEDIEESLQYFLKKLRPDLKASLGFEVVKPTIERWIDISKRGGSFGLGARLGMVTLLLRRVLVEGAPDSFAHLKTHVRALEEDSKDFYYKNKPRLFLANSCKSPLAIYSCFYFAEDLPFASLMSGMTFRNREPVYASDLARECLWELSGTIAVKSGVKGSFVIKCTALQLDDVFCFAEDCTFELEEDMKVTFVLAVRDGGLVALGLRKA